MEYYFDTFVMQIHPNVAVDVEGHEGFKVKIWRIGTNPNTAAVFDVLRPQGPTGPFRELAIVQDVLHDLWRESANLNPFRFPYPPPEGAVGEAWRKYVDQVKAVSSPHWADDLRVASGTAGDFETDRLHDEDGTTARSHHNAKVLLNRYGLPEEIRLLIDDSEYVVKGDWLRYRDTLPPAPNISRWMTHEFKGFSWGHLGTGPQGLAEFFRMIDLNIPRLPVYITSLPGPEDKKKPAKWTRGRKAWDPTAADMPGLPVFKKGVDYGVGE